MFLHRNGNIKDRRILVAENDYFVADELVAILTSAGAEVVGPASMISDALALVETDGRLDGAIIDIDLTHQAAWPLVSALTSMAVPIVLTTAYSASTIPVEYSTLPRVLKPTEGRDVLQVLMRTWTSPAGSKSGES